MKQILFYLYMIFSCLNILFYQTIMQLLQIKIYINLK